MNFIERFDQATKNLAAAGRESRSTLASEIVKEANKLGVYAASILPLYQALGRKELEPITIPAFNLRGLTYHIARVIWRTVLERHCGPVIFELAPAESTTGDQSFDEFAAMVLAAACREGYRGPVFLQGDHFSIETPKDETAVQFLAKEVVESGFYHIDIDGSHLINTDSDKLEVIHRQNAEITARMITYLRTRHTSDTELVLGGEVGEIGGKNTSVADLEAFYRLITKYLEPGISGLDKISVQTGTTHSGIVLQDGSLGSMNVDFDLTATLSSKARDLGWNGLVQHGASTLTISDLAKLPAAGVIEVHLATHIQNIIFDHPAFPVKLRKAMQDKLVVSSRGAEGDVITDTDSLTQAQQFYKARWTAWGLFKSELWELTPEVLTPIEESLAFWVAEVCTALRITDRAHLMQEYF